jgi:hypothetical protein
MYTDELDEACRERDLTLLCDAIFVTIGEHYRICHAHPRGVVDAHDARHSAVGVPGQAEAEALPVQARGLIEMGTRITKFKLCVKGENVSPIFNTI